MDLNQQGDYFQSHLNIWFAVNGFKISLQNKNRLRVTH